MSKLPPDIAIRVDGIHKDFHLPHHNEDSLKSKIITAFEKKDKEIDTQHALRGITFDIKKGEFYGILGRNGSGKSTLLKIISEIYQPTKGKIQKQGSLVAFIELGVGFNPQLSGRENVYLNAALLGFSRKEIDGFYDKVVSFAELEDHMEQKLKNYSSGMKVRLAFAVAIQAHADILVLDEVLAVGDADFQRKCYNYFKELKEENKTIVFVSHSMPLVKEYCDKAILIEDGKITHEGNADEVANAYTSLFNQAKDTTKKSTTERWGSREVEFAAVYAEVTEKKVSIKVELQAEADVGPVIAGLDIFDNNDRLVTGVAFNAAKEHSFNIAAGGKKSITYVFQNYFGGGGYKINVSAKSLDGNYVYDFWKGAATFDNKFQTSTYFPSMLPVDINVS
jgi:ABC-2 type transport system ATP-binding protein